MIQIDAPVLAIFITILLSLMGMAAGWGSLHEKVKHNCKDIEANARQNREDHQLIFNKLDSIQHDLKNGARNHGD